MAEVVAPALASNVALQLTAPSAHHGYSGSASVPGSALVRALGLSAAAELGR
jgi:hypothetical protein